MARYSLLALLGVGWFVAVFFAESAEVELNTVP
jgi:hypothetical protein